MINVSVTDILDISDSLRASSIYRRDPSDTLLSDEYLSVVVYKLHTVTLATDAVTMGSDSVIVEVIDAEANDAIFVTDSLLANTSYVRDVSDTAVLADAITAQRGGLVDRSASDASAVTDVVKYILQPGVATDSIFVADATTVELVEPLNVILDSDGYGLTLVLPSEVRYDSLQELGNYRFAPEGRGVPFQVLGVTPVVTTRRAGSQGCVVPGAGLTSKTFRISGSDATASAVVTGSSVTVSEALSVQDSLKAEILGASPVTVENAFVAGNVNDYLLISGGVAPGYYRIVAVIDPYTVTLDKALPIVDSANGALSWQLTSAVQALRFSFTNKASNQESYRLRIRGLKTKTGGKFAFDDAFLFSGINGPGVSTVDIDANGTLVIAFDQEMQADAALVDPSEYRIVGPTPVRIQKVWSLSPSKVALETQGLVEGSYTLQVNYAGTPKDLAGNPINPFFSQAVFSGSPSLMTRSVFSDKGPIAKPELLLQSGFGASITDFASVTLPGAALTGSHVGKYLRLGSMGSLPTTSSGVTGTSVTISDTVTLPDSLVVDLQGPVSKTVYATPSGVFKIIGVVSSTRVKVQASFSIPERANGSLYWEVVDPRNGEIADDPSDVQVTVNGRVVTPQAVIGLLGQVVLDTVPSPSDEVKINYSWCSNPVVEIRRLNSREFRLNAWNRDQSSSPTQHQYRYNNTLLTPSAYTSTSSLAVLDQPMLRELHYRAYERAYTAVLNDPTSLRLNSPTHRIAFPPAQRTLTEKFVAYEATLLPEHTIQAPWVRHGVGAASVAFGTLTVIDNISGVFPFGQPIFWTQDLDLTFPHHFAMSWRFQITATPVLDGVFTGIGVGYTDELSAYVVGFLNDGGVKKVGFLKRGSGDDPSLVSSWTGGLDSQGLPTGAPAPFDWSILHSYRIFRDADGTVRLLVDGNVGETLRILSNESPFLTELNAPFDEIQGAFFGSLSRVSESTSKWDFVRYLILPTNPLQTSPASYVDYEGEVVPELALKPWTPVGFHGTSTIFSNTNLLLDSTSASDAATEASVGLMGGDFKGYVRLEPLLTSASQVVLDISTQLRTFTHGVDPYGLMAAVDDGTRLTQVSFLANQSLPKFSYGGRSLPEDFSPYAWIPLGGAQAAMVGRALRITDTVNGDGRVYVIDDTAPPMTASRVVDSSSDYFLEFRNEVVSYTPDVAGFIGAFAQVFDGTRSVGVLLYEVSGVRGVALHSEGVVVDSFAFEWNDSAPHTYRMVKNTFGNLVSVFVDGVFLGASNYSDFSVSAGVAFVSFGSSTPASASALSVVDWSYCNAWRASSTVKRYVGIWKGYDPQSFTGYHLPLKVAGKGATVVGNALGDSQADFTGVAPGDALIVDYGPNKGVYEVAGVSSIHSLTILGTWPSSPTLTDYRIVRETDWSVQHKYRLSRGSSGEVALLLDNDPAPLVLVGYNSIDLPNSGVGIVTALSNGLPAIAFGAFSPENLSQSNWDFVRYGVSRSPTELKASPHHQVLNQWNVMGSPERLFTHLPHTLTSFKSSSTGIVPNTDPDFLENPALIAFTQLNDSTPLVPSTQAFEVRDPHPVQEYVSGLNNPNNVLGGNGFFLNDSTIRYRLVVPDDVLYTSLNVIEQSAGAPDLVAPIDDECQLRFKGLSYQNEVCLIYNGTVLPEDDLNAPTRWIRESDIPAEVFATASAGILTYRTVGSQTVYKNNTPLPDAPGLTTEVKFRLRLVDDATAGTGDTNVKFGLSAPGLTVALAFVTLPNAERLVMILDLNSGNPLGSFSFDFLDGAFHNYRIVRDPGAGTVRIFIDS